MTYGMSAPRTWLWLIAGLILISNILFVIGSVIEQSQGEASEVPGSHQTIGESAATNEGESGEASGTHQEGEETHKQEAHSEAESREKILGLNLESPWLVAGFVFTWLVLVVALLRWGQWVLVPVILIAGVSTLLDLREVLFQIEQSHTNIAIVAGAVTFTHAGIVIVAILTMWLYRASAQSGTRET
ncbi:MAG: hypothetical protein HYR94_07600 [Chloroflexi bacterium]|nr:hypothetical protein [Chloroflexota bacterium]